MTAETVPMSVIVPAYQCARMLSACIDGLNASDLPRSAWELIVVDDGSTDDTAAVAERSADVVLRVADGPRGPAFARNLGARAARGEVLVFIDADVVVGRSTLRGFADHFASEPSVAAIFGAYDDSPADPGVVSQYRNLLHRYVHARDAGEAETFWAGCGAVRRDAFLAVGGFDAVRYPRPQIEDIELGYRLKARGERIVLDPELVGTHLKRWTLFRMLRTDLRERAIPWMHLLLSRRTVVGDGPLNLAVGEKVLTALAGIGTGSLVLALVTQVAALGWLAAACAAMIIVGNAKLFGWFARRRGWMFAVATMPLRLLFYVVSAVGGAWAIVTHAGYTVPSALAPLQSTPDLRSRESS
jgi:GT2 family glycosyltransferase